MLTPVEMKLELPMTVGDGEVSTTTCVWEVLTASRRGDLASVKKMTVDTPGLLYAQYNYTPPIYFAVREGHVELAKFLLGRGALDPSYRTYPFLDTLVSFAADRGHAAIAHLLDEYLIDPSRHHYKGDCGEITYERTPAARELELAVDAGDVAMVRQLLKADPELVHDETYMWSEGILLFPAKSGNWELIDLLIEYGATVPKMTKWARFYYFERTDSAKYLLERGMDPNHHSWHRVTLLHDMAHAGDIEKARLLIDHGANIDAIDDEYRSTPLGFAARWGNRELVEVLLNSGADPNLAGSNWAAPLAWAERYGRSEIAELLRKAGAAQQP